MSPKDLEAILNTEGRTLSDNPGLNRATVAIIYYNSGQLDLYDREWVKWPGFAEAMSSTLTLYEGLDALRRPFILPLLSLDASFSTAVNASVHAIIDAGRDVPMVAARDAANVAAGGNVANAIYGAAWKILPNPSRDEEHNVHHSDLGFHIEGLIYKAYKIAYSLAEKAADKADEKVAERGIPRDSGIAAAEAAWQVVLEKQPQIQAIINQAEIKRTNPDADPVQIITDLLGIDLSPVVPKVRCYYLYMISKMLQVIPKNADLSDKFNKTVEKYGCGVIFEHEPLTEKELSTSTSEIGESTETIPQTPIGRVGGRPPSEEEIIQRLLQL